MEDMGSAMTKAGVVWGKPEQSAAKITKWLAIGAIGVATFWFWGLIVPFVLATLANTLLAGVYATGIVLLALIASSKKVHALVSAIGRDVFRSIASFWVETHPIGILKNQADEIDGYYEKLDTQTKGLNGEIEGLEAEIRKNATAAKKALSTYKLAKQAKVTSEDEAEAVRESAILSASDVGLLNESNVTLQDVLNRMRPLYERLKKIRFNVKILGKRTRQQINVKEREFNAVNKAYGAYSSAMAAVSGGSASQRELVEMACAAIERSNATKLGAIKDFVASSSGFLAGINLQQGAWEQDAEKMLAQMEEQSELLLGDGAETVIVGEYTDPDQVAQSPKDDVAALFVRR